MKKFFKKSTLLLALLTTLLVQTSVSVVMAGGAEVIPLNSITTIDQIELTVGGEFALIPDFDPIDATNQNVTYSSDNDKVASVDVSGLITANAAGTATITATSDENPAITASTIVLVTEGKGGGDVAVTGISYDTATADLFIGDTGMFGATLEPFDATNQTISYTSDNSKVLSVLEDGTYEALAAGTATVTATSADGGFTAKLAVNITADVLLGPALTPEFSEPTATADGFKVDVTNYDDTYTFEVLPSAGKAAFDDVNGVITVTGLGAGKSSTVTVNTTQDGYEDGTGEVTGTALLAALTPKFGTVTKAAAGFSVAISNYDGKNYTWTAKASVGTATLNKTTGAITVSGLAVGASSTLTVTTTRTGYATGSATVVGSALLGAALNPTFSAVAKKDNGFTVQINGYNAAFTYKATTTAGEVSISKTGQITVTGLDVSESAKVTVTTTRTGYASGTGTVTGTANVGAALKGQFGTVTKTADGFKVQIKNYNKAFTWKATVSAGKVSVSSTGLITVTGLKKGAAATVTLATTRTGYTAGSATIKGNAK